MTMVQSASSSRRICEVSVSSAARARAAPTLTISKPPSSPKRAFGSTSRLCRRPGSRCCCCRRVSESLLARLSSGERVHGAWPGLRLVMDMGGRIGLRGSGGAISAWNRDPWPQASRVNSSRLELRRMAGDASLVEPPPLSRLLQASDEGKVRGEERSETFNWVALDAGLILNSGGSEFAPAARPAAPALCGRHSARAAPARHAPRVSSAGDPSGASPPISSHDPAFLLAN